LRDDGSRRSERGLASVDRDEPVSPRAREATLRSPMIRLHYSNRTEALVRALAARVAERADPLTPVAIVVPNRAMERWVEMQLAARLGIAANLRFARLERFVAERLASGEGAPRIVEAAAIEGRLLAT